jgi:hypothetical protein
MNMARKLANPNPVVISHGKLKQVADQLRGYTFCHDCEQMLSYKGEHWVLANIPEVRLATSFGPFRRFNLAHLGAL